MINPNDLKYMIKLLDDPDESIRERVCRDLKRLGGVLDSLIEEQGIFLTSSQRGVVDEIKREHRKKVLEELIVRLSVDDEKPEDLEEFVITLSEYLSVDSSRAKIKSKLDSLTEEYKESASFLDAFSLARYIFKVLGYTGNVEDYFNPLNSDIYYVLNEHKGIPISLAVLYILIARRMNIEVSGCNFPGHFMAWFREGEEIVIVDCFGGGKFLYFDKIRKISPELYKYIKISIDHGNDDLDIIERMIRNLVLAFKKTGNQAQSDYFYTLLEILQSDLITDSEE